MTPEQIAASLTKAQRQIVFLLGPYDDFGFYSFKAAASVLGLEYNDVRTEMHGLRDLGLLVFHAGLVTEDGDFRGSGYALNSLGLDVQEVVNDLEDAALIARIKKEAAQ